MFSCTQVHLGTITAVLIMVMTHKQSGIVDAGTWVANNILQFCRF